MSIEASMTVNNHLSIASQHSIQIVEDPSYFNEPVL